jgi:hypothetical protein
MDTVKADTVTLIVASFSKSIPVAKRQKLQGWLKSRLVRDSVKPVIL